MTNPTPTTREREIIASLIRHSHYFVDEDCWYSCPEHPDYCGNDKGCNCGLDAHNAKLDELDKLITAALARERREALTEAALVARNEMLNPAFEWREHNLACDVIARAIEALRDKP